MIRGQILIGGAQPRSEKRGRREFLREVDQVLREDPFWRTSKTCALGIGARPLVVWGQPDGGSRQVGRRK